MSSFGWFYLVAAVIIAVCVICALVGRLRESCQSINREPQVQQDNRIFTNRVEVIRIPPAVVLKPMGE